MNIETDSRNINSEKTLYGASKEFDHEEYSSYFKPGVSPSGNLKTASPTDVELENQYKNYLTPQKESFNGVYKDTPDEKNNSMILVVFVLAIFLGVFYLSKKYITVEHKEVEVPIGITTKEPTEKEEEE